MKLTCLHIKKKTQLKEIKKYNALNKAWNVNRRESGRKNLPQWHSKPNQNHLVLDFPGGAVVKNSPANAGDTGSSPGPERSHMPRSN